MSNLWFNIRIGRLFIQSSRDQWLRIGKAYPEAKYHWPMAIIVPLAVIFNEDKMNQTEKQLLPCPFCGSDSNLEIADNGSTCYWVICNSSDCGCESPYRKTSAQATAAWNHRTQPAAAGDVWQPIETAPKDESVLIVCCATPENSTFYPRSIVYQAVYEDGEWVSDRAKLERGGKWRVTHWQPLPQPPAAIGEKQ